VIFDIDIKGGVNVKRIYGDNALSLFIQPPGIEELRRRLVGRATDTQEQIEIRLAKAEYEMSFASKFDRIIINDDLEIAKEETLRVIKEYLNRE
jgi:guanylate kinase